MKFFGTSLIIIVGLVTGVPVKSPGANVTIAWLPSTDPAIASYNLYYGVSSRLYTNFVSVGSATNATINNLDPGLTYYFAGTAVDINGLESAYSDELVYQVPQTNLIAPTLTLQPLSQTVVLGSVARFQITASGTAPLSYQWTLNGANLSGATTNALTVANVQTAQAGGYAVVVTNIAGAITSIVARLTVVLPPTILTQPTNQTRSFGSNASFVAAASGTPPLDYQWFFNGTNLVAEGTNVLSLTNVQPSQAGTYNVRVTNQYGAALSSVATLTVLVPPSITQQPSNQTATAGTDVSFQLTASGTEPLSYQWMFNGAGLAGQTAQRLSLTNVQSRQSGLYNVAVTNLAGSITSMVATLTILVAPTITAVDIAGPAVSLGFESIQGINYVLEYKDALSSSLWISISPNMPGTGGPFKVQDTNVASVSRFYRIRAY